MFHFALTLLILSVSINNVFAHGVALSSSAFIISPQHNALVNNPVRIKFGVEGILIAPAGVNKHKAGHYHLLVDTKETLSMDDPIPRDKHHIHFDQGEKQTSLNLSPGKHTLQLIIGDEEHEPFEQLVSKKITIFVK